MLFNSYAFLFAFLPACWVGYFTLNRFNKADASKWWLLLASFFFYSYWNIAFLPHLLFSIGFNYFLAEKILKGTEKQKKGLFYAGLVVNLGLLGYYKYMNFFLDNLGALTSMQFPALEIILPLGISFYTLQQVAYLVDVYQGICGEKRFIDYALFVAFFPKILQGPIASHDEVIPQFQSLKTKVFNSHNIALGIYLISLGLAKKVLIADTLSVWVNDSYARTADLHFFAAWGTSLSYTLQLYFDFSGYTDMAIGLGYLFNIKLPQNFNSPLSAGNINDFWSRWHITLTNFIRTYIFTPIAQLMPSRAFHWNMLAMFLAMTIAGIWHGAAWTYVIYGMIHGAAIVGHYYWKKKKKKMPKFMAWLLTFNFVNVSFVLFRSGNLTEAKNVLSGMLGLQGFQIPKGVGFKELGIKLGPYMTNDENIQLLMLALGIWVILKAKNSGYLEENFKPANKLAMLSAAMFVFAVYGMTRVSDFIYFNF